MQQQTVRLLSAAVSWLQEASAVWRANALGPKAALKRWVDGADSTGFSKPQTQFNPSQA